MVIKSGMLDLSCIAAKHPQCQQRLDTLIGQLLQVPQPGSRPLPIKLPGKDQPILLAAMAALATHLLTGDLRHFGPHMNRSEHSAGITMQTVSEYLAG